MYIWKIEPFEVASTDRTAMPKQIVGIEIAYFAGKVAVSDLIHSPVTLIIDYYDSEGQKREYLQDRVDMSVIQSKGIAMGKSNEELEGFIKYSMDVIVKHIIGGETIAERHSYISLLSSMFGQVLLPLEAQTGTI